MSQSIKRLSAAASIERLIEGNERFINGLKSIESFSSRAKLRELADNGQTPFCIVVTCCDSRVPAEMIFDCSLGDLYVIRIAGNVISPDLIASIEYAASQLSPSLCVVMGHTRCGAVRAALDYSSAYNTTQSDSMTYLLRKILPSVAEAKRNLGEGNEDTLARLAELNNAMRNAKLVTQASDLIRSLCQQGEFSVVDALYDLHTGTVSFDLEAQKNLLIEAHRPKGSKNFDESKSFKQLSFR
jgi:carbonic anhydrase